MDFSLYLFTACLAVCFFAYVHFLLLPKRYSDQSKVDEMKIVPHLPVKYFRPAPPRRSGGSPKPQWVVDAVLHLYDEHRSYRLAQREFNRLFAHRKMSVCLSTVYAWVQKYRSKAETVRKQTRNRFPAHVMPNLCWCLDGTGKRDAQGFDHFILTIVDHGTRLNLALARVAHADSNAILEHIAAAVAQFGKPVKILTDNASVFKSVLFRDGMAALGIRQQFTKPRRPWMNGKAERFILMQKEKLNNIVPEDAIALDALLGTFRFWYNAVRSHQHLHGFTPAEAWAGIDPYGTAPKAVVRFEAWGGLLHGYYKLR